MATTQAKAMREAEKKKRKEEVVEEKEVQAPVACCRHPLANITILYLPANRKWNRAACIQPIGSTA